MSDPYNYPFIKKDNTMYLSTICKHFDIQLKTTSKFLNHSIDSPLFNSMISLAPHQRFLSQKILPEQIFPYQLIYNLFQILVKRSIKHQIPYLLMIFKAQDQKLLNSEVKELSILFVLNIFFLQHHK